MSVPPPSRMWSCVPGRDDTPPGVKMALRQGPGEYSGGQSCAFGVVNKPRKCSIFRGAKSLSADGKFIKTLMGGMIQHHPARMKRLCRNGYDGRSRVGNVVAPHIAGAGLVALGNGYVSGSVGEVVLEHHVFLALPGDGDEVDFVVGVVRSLPNGIADD